MGDEPVPADGADGMKGAADGVNAPADRGRTPGGESGGGGYDGGPAGAGENDGFMGHGGQTVIAHHGGGQAGDTRERPGNGVAGGQEPAAHGGEAGPKPGPGAPYGDRVAEQTRDEAVNGHEVSVFEESGVAAAEFAGNTGAAGDRRANADAPEATGGG